MSDNRKTITLYSIRMGLLAVMLTIVTIIAIIDAIPLRNLLVILVVQLISFGGLVYCTYKLQQESDWPLMVCWLSITCNHIAEYMDPEWQMAAVVFEKISCVLVVLYLVRIVCKIRKTENKKNV